MRVKSVRVRMFRNILDSDEVAIDAKVTCLVGKNESGKTGFLHALWRLNPARTNPTFSIPDQYPAWLEKRHRLEGKDLGEEEPIAVQLEWEPTDVAEVEARFGSGVVAAGAKLRVAKTYCNEHRWTSGCDEAQAVKNFIAETELAESSEYEALSDFSTLSSKLQEDAAASKERPELLSKVTRAQAALNTLLGKESFDDVLWSIAFPRIPRFLYFAEYSRLPYTAKIQDVLKGQNLSEGDATARALLTLGGTEAEYMLNPDYERRKRELENVANVLTDDVNNYWSQNPDL